MPTKLLSIEVCDRITLICLTEKKGKNIRVFDSFMFRTPEGCVSDGVIANTQILATELKNQLAAHNLSNMKSVCFTLSSSKIAVREVKFPPIKGKKLSDAIKTNAPEYFPVDLSAYHVTYNQLEYVAETNPYLRVQVMAAPLSMIDGYFKLAEASGLSIKAIDICGNSQYQVLRHLKIKGVTIYVDVGSSSSLVSFILEDKLLLQRTFAFGVDELISRYISASGIDKSYLDAIHETDISCPDFAADNILSYDDIQSDLNRLVSGIMRSVDFFNSSQWEHTASKVVLMGSCRHTVGLRDFVSSSTGLDTAYLDDLPEFASFAGGASDAAAYTSCIGSALAPLDFMPPQYVTNRRPDKGDTSLLPGIIICALLVFGGIAISLLSVVNYKSTAAELNSINTQISSLEGSQKEYTAYVSYQKSDAALKELAANSDTPNSKLVSFFQELEKNMPSSILLMSASCNDESVSMNITVEDYTDAASAISDLREFESIKVLKVGDIIRKDDGTGALKVYFTVSCAYGENPYLNKTNPYLNLITPSPSASPSASPNASPAASKAASPTPTEDGVTKAAEEVSP